jgi:hypothetical protein
MPSELMQLMARCWAENPEDRPSFHEIVTALDDQIDAPLSSDEEDEISE